MIIIVFAFRPLPGAFTDPENNRTVVGRSSAHETAVIWPNAVILVRVRRVLLAGEALGFGKPARSQL